MCPIPVLVTAVGGNVGQGVVKALRAARRSFHIVGVDMEPLSAGFSFVDAYYLVPRSGAPGFLDRLREIKAREGMEALYVCSHAELEYFAENRAELRKELDAAVFVNPPEVVAIGSDKLRTAQFLAEAGLPQPQTVSAHDRAAVQQLIDRHGFPVVVKPRRGAASKNVLIVGSAAELSAAEALIPGAVVQQHLADEHAEHTAGTVSDAEGRVRACIVLHRDLLQGTTYRTELVQDDAITRQVVRIVERLGAVGPCNVQFRLVGETIFPFEINPRFSGTSGIRYVYGFNDAELTYELLREGRDCAQPALRPGVVLRYWDEVYIAGATFETLRDGTAPHVGRQTVLMRPAQLLE